MGNMGMGGRGSCNEHGWNVEGQEMEKEEWKKGAVKNEGEEKSEGEDRERERERERESKAGRLSQVTQQFVIHLIQKAR